MPGVTHIQAWVSALGPRGRVSNPPPLSRRHPAMRVAGDTGTARGILWRAFKRPPCSESIFVQLLGWLCPSLPLAPRIPAIAPLSQERAAIDSGATPDLGSGLPWSAAAAHPCPGPGGKRCMEGAGQVRALGPAPPASP